MTTATCDNQQYELFSTIDQGSISTIYEGYDHQFKRSIVIKELREEFRDNAEVTETFWAEATLLAGINHASILRVYDIDHARHWIIMEPMQGSLATEIKSGKPTPERLREILKQLLEGVRHLHQLNRIHGQIRLDTVLVDSFGQTKLSNLSLADIHDEFRRPDHKQLHTAPEVLNAKHFGSAGLSSDLYCVGMVALQLAAGDKFLKLFKGMDRKRAKDPLAWSAWHASIEPVGSVRSVVDDLPPDIAAVIDGLTRKQVGLRLANAADALHMLHPVATGNSPVNSTAAVDQDQAAMNSTVAAITYNSPNLFTPLTGRTELPNQPAWDSWACLGTSWRDRLMDRKLQLGAAAAGSLTLLLATQLILGEQYVASREFVSKANTSSEERTSPMPQAEPKPVGQGQRQLWIVAADSSSESLHDVRIFINQVPTAIDDTSFMANQDQASLRQTQSQPKPIDLVVQRASNTTLNLVGTTGIYHVRVEATNYQSREELVEVKDTELEPVKLQLQPRLFALNIGIEPAQADLYLVGGHGEVGQRQTAIGENGQTVRLLELPAGQYWLCAKAGGFASEQRLIQVGEDCPQPDPFRLVALQTYSLWLDSYPQGATISLDGRDIGSTPLYWTGQEDELYALTLTKAGYVPVEESIKVRATLAGKKLLWYLEGSPELLANSP